MKTHKTVEAHVEKKQVVESITCDCCGKRAHAVWRNEPMWTNQSWRSSSGTLSASETIEDDTDYKEVDICWSCASRLIAQVREGQVRFNQVEE